MRDYKSLSHTCWDCKYHIVFIPKPLEDADSEVSPDARTRRNMMRHDENGYSLFKCYNAVLAFGLTSRRAEGSPFLFINL